MQSLLIQNSQLKHTIKQLEDEIKQRCRNFLKHLQSRSPFNPQHPKITPTQSKSNLTFNSLIIKQTLLTSSMLSLQTLQNQNLNSLDLPNIQMQTKSTQFTNKQLLEEQIEVQMRMKGEFIYPTWKQNDESSLLISSVSVPENHNYASQEIQQTLRGYEQMIRKYEEKIYVYEQVFGNIASIVKDNEKSQKEQGKQKCQQSDTNIFSQQYLHSLFITVRQLKQYFVKGEKSRNSSKSIIDSLNRQNRNKMSFNKQQLQKLTKQLSFGKEEDEFDFDELRREDEEYEETIREFQLERMKSNNNSPNYSPVYSPISSSPQIQKQNNNNQQQLLDHSQVARFSIQRQNLSVISEKTSEYRLSENFVDKDLNEIKDVERLNSTQSENNNSTQL